MKKSKKVWLIVATVFVLAGLGVSAVALTMVGWDYTKLSNVKYETKTFEIGESFNSLSVDTHIDDIRLAPAEDNHCRVVCYEHEKLRHTVAVAGDTLTVGVEDKREWYDLAQLFSFESPQITVYLPKKAYSDLRLSTAVGSIGIPEDFSFKTMRIKSHTGSVTCRASAESSVEMELGTGGAVLSDISTNELRLSSSTGSVSLSSVICKNEMKVETSTGSVVLNGCDADSLLIKTSTGSVSGTLLSEKVFITDTSTGSVHVPDTTTGGRCEIKTSTGSIDIAIADK